MLSLPNLLTLARIAAIPLVVASFWLDRGWAQWTAAALFFIASVTDYFDGWLARRWQQVSRLGRFLDPIADKLLVAAALLVLVADNTIGGWSLWAALVILSREILVSGLREFLAEVRVSVPVSRLAKWKTGVQMAAIAVLLVGSAGERLMAHFVEIGLGLLWASAILTLYTGYDYLRTGLKHVVEEEA